jgi:hypothetical protein
MKTLFAFHGGTQQFGQTNAEERPIKLNSGCALDAPSVICVVDINKCRPLFSASGHHRRINVVARNLLVSNPVLAKWRNRLWNRRVRNVAVNMSLVCVQNTPLSAIDVQIHDFIFGSLRARP